MTTTSEQLMLPLHRDCQGWRKRRSSYRPARAVIDPSRYAVEAIEHRDAKRFVVEHHYSASYPADRVRVGLHRRGRAGGWDLVGVAVYSVPCNTASLRRWLGVGLKEGVELGRLVLLDDVPANGESWFIARATRIMLGLLPEVRSVLAYSDPVPRQTIDGDTVLPGHVGWVYQATNARYMGRGSKRTLLLAPDGRVVNGRALSKIRNEERGWRGAVRRIEEMGAASLKRGESPRSWLERVKPSFRRMRHPGNHVYGWTLGGADLRACAKPRPKQADRPREAA